MDFLSQLNLPSPLQHLDDPIFEQQKLTVFLKRDDQIHPSVSGNKFRKLTYNWAAMHRLGFRRVVTFGGAFSNHIHAVAAAGRLAGIETVGIIRGENAEITEGGNPTLDFARSQGMELRFVSRSDYRDKGLIIKNLTAELGAFYVLPEGGTNLLAMQGTAALPTEIENQLGSAPDFLCAPCGTGGTLAGMVVGASEATQILGFSALKGEFLHAEVAELVSTFRKNPFFFKNTEGGQNPDFPSNWSINTAFHFGGYARWSPELIQFIQNFKAQHGIALDPVYTGKMFFGIYHLAQHGFFPKNTTIVAVHTGGLQGIQGFNKRFNLSLSY